MHWDVACKMRQCTRRGAPLRKSPARRNHRMMTDRLHLSNSGGAEWHQTDLAAMEESSCEISDTFLQDGSRRQKWTFRFVEQ